MGYPHSSSRRRMYKKINKTVIIDDDQNTKLHYAAALDNVEEINKIIASRQKLDPENYLGWTPLMMAIRNENASAVDTLLLHGANPIKKNKFGISAFLMSVACGDIAIMEKILNHSLSRGISKQCLEKSFSPVSLAILCGHNQMLRYLLELCFDPNAATSLTGITPLMFASVLRKEMAVKKLLQFKADIDKKNHLGITAGDIEQYRGNGIETYTGENGPQALFAITSHLQNSPHLQLTPYPEARIRKSSSPQSPNMIYTPKFSPNISQSMGQQFFGPDFGTCSPSLRIFCDPFLNATISCLSNDSSWLGAEICYPEYV
ncbi:hypothetical protein Zmor_015275 [Zophobas morio]|uniref:Uncharacterized protein n=1 Tax=Zophobas morio TaxID=2755281 RepID=A0AA38IJN6_9CUCU|nr:hypothetical protein Zmor_015275 [Zophobas morio]